MVLGGEGAGVSAELLELMDDRLTIPMRPTVESLNVATAAALIAYEAQPPTRRRPPVTGSLFDDDRPGGHSTGPATTPLAERMRPRTLDEFVGQDALIAPDGRCAGRSSRIACSR